MNFISKAIEKARSVQPKKEPAVSPAAPRVMPPPQAPPRGGDVDGSGITRNGYVYTRTRTVSVDPNLLRRHKLIAGGNNDPVSEEYKVLRTKILSRTRADHRNTLMITGPWGGEGKTLTAINLAISLSQEENQTVLLIDADLRRPCVHRYFGLPQGPGLRDYLMDGVPLSELLVHPEGLARFIMLPGGKPSNQAPELISSPAMTELAQEVKYFYPNRYVIFDLPPLLNFADALAFAPLMDGIILVVEAGRNTQEDIEQCTEFLKGLPILGFVVNKIAPQEKGKYYESEYPFNQEPLLKRWFRSPFK
jgi:protein-tyrosine kinase